MCTNRWGRLLHRALRPCRPASARRATHFAPRLDPLEDRVVPASYSVTTTTDYAILSDNSDVNYATGQITDQGNVVSLRSAVIASNHTAGPNSITLPAGTYLLTRGPADDELNQNGAVEQTGDLDVFANSLTITGAGSATTVIDGNAIDRIFDVQSPNGASVPNSVTFNLSGVTLQNGHAPADGSLNENGGAIAFNGAGPAGRAPGQLTLNNVVVKNNTAEGSGGGLFVQSLGAMTLTNVTFDGNAANHGGGGAIAYPGSTGDGNVQVQVAAFTNNKALDSALGNGGAIQISQSPHGSFVVSYSSFSGNQAGANGGALSVENSGTTSNLSLRESTVAGNSAGASGGGVFVNDTAGGTASLLSATVTSNRANTAGGSGVGGGIDAVPTPAASGVALVNTIVAGNFNGSSGSTADDARGNLATGSSYNLFGTGGAANLTGGNSSHNLFNVASPGLGPLGNYGGPTLTVPLLAGSPALDAGANPDASNTDQRNGGSFVRVVDLPGVPNAYDSTDIGAFESRGFSLTLVGSDSESTTVGTQFPNPLRVGVTARDTNVPVNGALVLFTGPVTTTDATIYPNPTGATVSGGIASATVYANFMSSPTSYTVLASLAGGVNTVPFHLTNTPAQADLAVSNVGPTAPIAGTDVTFTITVKNNGPNDAQNVKLSDTLPGSTTSFVSQSQTSGPAFTLGNSGNVINDTITTLAASATAVFSVVAHVPASVANNTLLSDTATVTGDNTDPNLSNNGSTTGALITTRADVAVTQTGPMYALAGTNVSYTIGLTNNGPSDAQGVVLGDTLPAGETFVSLSQASGPAFTPGVGGSTFSEFINTLASGASASFTVVAQVNANVANNTVLNNTATVSASTTDPTSGNNSSTVATRINPLSNLAVIGAAAHLTAQGAADGLTLTFNESVQASTFMTAAVDSLTGPGGAIPPTGVTSLSATQFEVTFAPQTTAGTYTLVVGPYVSDLAGNPMDQNGDGIGGGDPGDRYTTTFGLPLPAALPFQENFDDGAAHAFVSQSGSWSVVGGRYGAAPTSAVGDAVSLLAVSGAPPSSLEFDVTMNAAAASGNFYSNGFVVFDYQSATNFKYAGTFVGLQHWVVGHRDASGWHDDAAASDPTITPGTDYNLQLLLQGANVALLVNGASKVNYGYSSGFTGSVGLGTDNSVAQYDNLTVRQYNPPGGGTLPIQQNFDDGVAHYFSPQSGSWAVSAGRYAAAPASAGADAVSTLLINGGSPSSLEFDVLMNAAAASGSYYSNGFIVFDYQGPTNFKFAGAYVGNQQWVIGHRDANGWQIDVLLGDSGIAAGSDYNLQLLLQGNSASLLVNGSAKVSHAYASAFSGSVGLGTQNGLTQFDNLNVQQS